MKKCADVHVVKVKEVRVAAEEQIEIARVLVDGATRVKMSWNGYGGTHEVF